MNLLYRRITYIIFFVIFLIIAPAVILYTQGYRYNFKRNRLQKTSILIISSNPKKANIYLNDKLIENKKTPARIEKLLPADYEIKLTKEGYYNWQKKLPAHENSTTFAEDIILWKKTLPVQLSTSTIIDWQISPNKKKIAYVDKNKNINYLITDTQSIKTIGRLNNYNNQKINSWSNTSKKIIIQAKKGKDNRYFIFNTENYKSKFILLDNQYLPPQVTKIKWDLESDNLLYSLNNQGIWQTDLFEKKHQLIITATATNDFLIKNGQAYLLKNGVIYNQKSNGSGIIKKIAKINCEQCQIINKSTDKLILLDKDNQKIFIIDPENETPNIEASAKTIDWLGNHTILFYNDWEIWIYELNKQEPELITRLGRRIQKVIWHPAGRHLIFATEDKIKVIELDNRELRNIIELATMPMIEKLNTDSQGRYLYFTGQLDDKDEMFGLEIR